MFPKYSENILKLRYYGCTNIISFSTSLAFFNQCNMYYLHHVPLFGLGPEQIPWTFVADLGKGMHLGPFSHFLNLMTQLNRSRSVICLHIFTCFL